MHEALRETNSGQKGNDRLHWTHADHSFSLLPIEDRMSETPPSRAERYFRFSQGSLVLALWLVLTLGALGLAVALDPESGARGMARAGWMLPVAIAIAAAGLSRSSLRGERW